MFSNLVGNPKAKEFLLQLISKERVPNALLFVGPESVGKKEFALEFARTLLCRSTTGGEACGECSICLRVTLPDLPIPVKGDDYDRVFLTGHPDVGLVTPYKRNLRVGAIRELEREAHFRPFEAEKRIFIVDDAEKMNDSASNALLKTLEEPPSTTHLILITARPDSLLQTILSRCQVIRFAPVESGEIEKFLLGGQKFSPADAALAAKVSRGSVGNALNMDIAQFRETRDSMLSVLRNTIVTGDISSMLQTSEQMNDAKNKDRFEETIGILQTLIRDIFALAKNADASQLSNADIANQLNELAENGNSARLESWLSEIEELLEGLNVNVNRKITADKLFVSMAA